MTPPVEPDDRELPSLRRRQPIVFWGALIGAGAMVVATFGSFLSAFL